MSGFRLEFTYPWLMLTMIPALFVALWIYFKVPKKYRRTRNRVISLVLHLIVVVLSVSVLSGLTLTYASPNTANRVVLLVDTSHSTAKIEEKRNNYVESILEKSDEAFSMAVVTFAKNQVLAADFSTDTKAVFQKYMSSDNPDDSATDIESALWYAADLLKESLGKIVLISDGIETDNNALSVIMTIMAAGIRIDTVYLNDDTDASPDAMIVDVVTPDYSISVDEVIKIGVTIQSSIAGDASISMYDNDERVMFDIDGQTTNAYDIALRKGTDTFEIEYAFATQDIHKLRFEIKTDNDTLAPNNTYFAYINLQVFDKILIINSDSGGGEAAGIAALLRREYKEVDVINILDAPKTTNELRAFDQVILVNIANSDLPAGFDGVLEDYVKIGGGLLTLGAGRGAGENKQAHAYNTQDMTASVYQSILPINCIDYTPPIAVMIIVDCSGSMQSNVPGLDPPKNTAIELAKDGIREAIDTLSERDYCGIISLSDEENIENPLIPLTRRNELIDAILTIEANGGTIYSGAIDRAVRALSENRRVEKKHILFISDGQPNSDDIDYEMLVENGYQNHGITLSYVLVGSNDASAVQVAENMSTAGNGRKWVVRDAKELAGYVRRDLEVPEIKDVKHEIFRPQASNPSAKEFSGITDKLVSLPQLGGFYGTKAKTNADVILSGEYVPIYAKWKYGEGKVGSFLSDLDGEWGLNFLSEIVESPSGEEIKPGELFILNAIKWLFPTMSIRPKEISCTIQEDNYGRVAIIQTNTGLKDGESLALKVIGPLREEEFKTIELEVSGDFVRGKFLVYDPGIYEIVIEKKDAGGNVIDFTETQTIFAYSKEYNLFVDPIAGLALLESIVLQGEGELIEDPAQIFDEGFTLHIKKVINPKIVFIIMVLILLLLDIAVRKFKFKWPWEIVRDYNAKKMLEEGKK